MKKLLLIVIVFMLVSCNASTAEVVPTEPAQETYYTEYIDLTLSVDSEESFWELMPELAAYLHKLYCGLYPGCFFEAPSVTVADSWEHYLQVANVSPDIENAGLDKYDTVATAVNPTNTILMNTEFLSIRSAFESIAQGHNQVTYQQIVFGMTPYLLEEIYHLDTQEAELTRIIRFEGDNFTSTLGFGFVTFNNWKITTIEEGSAVYISLFISTKYLGLNGEPPVTYIDNLNWFTRKLNIPVEEVIELHREADPVGLLYNFYGATSEQEVFDEFVLDYTNPP